MSFFIIHSLESPYGLPQRDGPWPLWPKNLHYNWCSLSNKACLTKFRAPMFCFPKEQLNTSSIQKVSWGSHFKNSTFLKYVSCKFLIYSNVLYSVALDIVPSCSKLLSLCFTSSVQKMCLSKYFCFLFCNHIDPFRNITLFKNISSKDYIFRMEEKLIKSGFSGFSGFPDHPGPENRVLPSWANPWTKRSPTTPQAWGSVRPISQFIRYTTPIY